MCDMDKAMKITKLCLWISSISLITAIICLIVVIMK